MLFCVHRAYKVLFKDSATQIDELTLVVILNESEQSDWKKKIQAIDFSAFSGGRNRDWSFGGIVP